MERDFMPPLPSTAPGTSSFILTWLSEYCVSLREGLLIEGWMNESDGGKMFVIVHIYLN